MKKRLLILLLSICILGCSFCIGNIIWKKVIKQDREAILEKLRDQLKTPQTTAITEIQTEHMPTELPNTDYGERETAEQVTGDPFETTVLETVAEEIEPDPSVISLVETEPPKEKTKPVIDSVLDFSNMWKMNTDICAWIEIEDTKVNYPILQNPNDDNKYLNTAIDGSYYIGGSLFTQATYNNKDFNDPVTVIYGHTMKSGALFGQLQSTYSNTTGFESHSEIKLYLPNEVRYYTVFAAVPYSNIHIMDAYDFSKPYWYENFFDGVMGIREFGVQLNKEIIPEPGDRVIVLSTCLNEDSTKRYLVMAIYQDDIE